MKDGAAREAALAAVLFDQLAGVSAERARRYDDAAVLEEARAKFYTMLDEMAARRRTLVGYVEPSPEQLTRRLADLDEYFSTHYG